VVRGRAGLFLEGSALIASNPSTELPLRHSEPPPFFGVGAVSIPFTLRTITSIRRRNGRHIEGSPTSTPLLSDQERRNRVFF
jgi:hypothetical protein